MKRFFLFFSLWNLLLAFQARATPPVILSEPQSITVNNASAAQFTVVASNAVSYQWQFDNNNLSGETNATLSLDDVSSNQAGSYTVVVTSSDSTSVTSAPPAVLTIVPGTIIQWTISTYPNGSSSNFLVQLFDHDKPATVENFIHYITSGIYSNMFFDRDVTNFVLQGGDYASADQSTNLDVHDVSPGTNFPTQVDNEFNVGPVIHNRFGTLAMAMVSGETNSASSAFFFNLVDNSASLDSQDFTVFGRILYGTNSGSNVLEYFNTLSAPSNGIYSNFSVVPNLPVNYDGTNSPTDANFFYCDFAFLSPPPVDTNPPTVSLTFPLPDAAFTNGADLTVRGAASDNVGLAEVFCVLTTLAGLSEGEVQTNAAIGTTNWWLDLGTNEPGIYQLTAYAQDGAGNLSAPATVYYTNLAVLTLITNANGALSTNLQYLVPGSSYSLTAEPPAGEQFVNWQNQGVVSLNPEVTFTAETNFTLTVTFASTNLPPGLAITSPSAGSVVQTVDAALTISGTIPSSVTVTQLTVQLFSQNKAVTPALLADLSSPNWSLAVSNLAGGPYTVVVVAEDSLGQEGVVTENFTALVAPPIITSQPASLTVNAGSAADFSITASNAVSYQWQWMGSALTGATNASLALDNVGTNQAGSYTVVLTAADGETVTSQPAVLTVVQGTILTLTLSRYAGGTSSNVTIELFNHDKPATVENFIHYITAGAYSNMFFDRCVPGFVLQGGDYVAADRSSNRFDGNPITPGTNFPSQVDSEFSVGPLIHNEFGTLAMALASGDPNSANSAFFINLADNSANLDYQNGGFTVFGRILSGSNVLQYFNTLSTPSNGVLDLDSTFSSLPVNYDGTNAPVDANLFFGDFTFVTQPPVDTVPPTVAVTVPAPNAAFTNGLSSAQGTAQDNVGLAEVFGILTPLTGTSSNINQTNIASGITNWSLSFTTSAPGIYRFSAFAQDGAGNLSAASTVYFTNMAQLIIVTNLNGQLTTNAPQYLVPGQQYSLTAEPEGGEQFYSWTANGITSLNPVQTFTANDNLTLTIKYIPTNLATGLAITAPVSGQQALSIQSVLTVSGTLPATNISLLTCQFYVNSNSVSIAQSAAISGTNWSLSVTNLTNGAYSVAATATDAAGDTFLTSANFTLLNVDEMNLNILPAEGGSVSGYKGQLVPPGAYSLKASPRPGYVFYSWNDGLTTTLNPSKTVNLASNLTLTATFVPQAAALQGITITYPPANARLTNGSFSIEGRLPASLTVTQMTCQLFLQSNGVTASPQTVAVASSASKWTFPVTNLTPGPYRVLATAYDSKGRGRLIAENFNLLAKLEVSVEPPGKGTVTASLNGQYLEVGKTYEIYASPKAGQLFAYWTGAVADAASPLTLFTVSSNMALTAYFTNNLFPAVAGTYTGLFLDPAGVTSTNAGFVTLTTSTNGVFSGKVMFPAHTIDIFPTQFSYTGVSDLSTEWVDKNVLSVGFVMDLTNGTDSVTGFVADQDAAGNLLWEDKMVLYRAVTHLSSGSAAAAGKYAVLLQPESGGTPPASGYAAFSLPSSGTVAFGGTLPDNTAISGSARMSKDGVWPVYCAPSVYGGKGMLIGWQTNTTSGASTGQLFWCKPGVGETISLISTGGVFTPPQAGSNYEMSVAGGAAYNLQISSAGQFESATPVNQISLLPTGVLSGQIEMNNKDLPFKGIFISPTAGGGGFILNDGTNNGFQISAQP